MATIMGDNSANNLLGNDLEDDMIMALGGADTVDGVEETGGIVPLGDVAENPILKRSADGAGIRSAFPRG